MASTSPSPAARTSSAVPLWLRIFFLANVVQDLAIGVSGLASPRHIVIPLKGLSPVNARFIAALYLGGGVVILAVAFVRRAVDARIALYAFFTITALVLVMTFAYWETFTKDGIPWLWLFTYIVDPLLAPIALVTLGVLGPARPGRHRLTALFVGEAIVFGGSGIALLLAPTAMLRAWPWTLTPILSRVYAAFFLAFAIGAALAAWERRIAAVRPLILGSLALLVVSLVASLVHLSKFDHGPGRWLWFAGHCLGVALFAFALATLRQRARGADALPGATPA
jgi:hypothetical protein